FADTKTELSMAKLTGGAIDFNIPAAWFQSLNPFFIILLAPVFSVLWVKLGKFNPPTVYKFAIDVLFAGLSYIIMVIPLSNDSSIIHPICLFGSFLLFTIGELSISPSVLSTTTKFTPKATIA